ncbi:hypothetical protein FIBSPDRAFT_194565 [Athelia psychrophila]|uniref:Carbonic anhydrase n=1 Tax=Athelia psychrophila TaxID=1759441 RepID=A0A166SLH9_9AGAM|nr:hypothetical protein FIBSPDRAFT_194565 [Fibularhizoctonia sp. CBS 109695]
MCRFTVSGSLVTAYKPGDIFVHRNIANQFYLNDNSAHLVLAYAITALAVQHVLVVCHTHRGGAAACISPRSRPLPLPSSRTPRMRRWMCLWRRTCARAGREPFQGPAVQDVWEDGTTMLWIHGLVYKIEVGTLADSAVSMGPDVERRRKRKWRKKKTRIANEKFSLEGMCTYICMYLLHIGQSEISYKSETMFFDYVGPLQQVRLVAPPLSHHNTFLQTFQTLPIVPLVYS